MSAQRSTPPAVVEITMATPNRPKDFSYWRSKMNHLQSQLAYAERDGNLSAIGSCRAGIAEAEARMRAAAG